MISIALPQIPPRYRNPSLHLPRLAGISEAAFMSAGNRRVLDLFRAMAERVPAYKKFLKRHKITAGKVKTIADFKKVPALDKDSYLRRYPLDELCWDGKFKGKSWVISATSGSTGEPFYFPRESFQDWQYAGMAELYLRTNFSIHTRSTLYIDAFPMGIWIGGLFTYEAIKTVAERGNYPLSIITPGIDKKEIINSIKRFGSKFDQIIIGCYAPFLKDALDEGTAHGIDWKKYPLKFIFSAESFSETFRDYLAEHAGLRNLCLDTLNHYGTVDLGTMSYETPISILIRRLAVKNSELYGHIFPVEHKLPTLTQYDPELFYFEEVGGGLLCSAQSGLPLVRYDLKDNGGIIGFRDMLGRISASGVDFAAESKLAKISETIWQMPFVYVYERQDFSVSLYAFQIYPETIRKAVQEKPYHPYLTGKFSMLIKYNARQNQYLEINVELKGNIKPSSKLKSELRRDIVRRLLRENSEYRKTFSEMGNKIFPKIVFWPYEHQVYFKAGVKQRWVIKKHAQ